MTENSSDQDKLIQQASGTYYNLGMRPIVQEGPVDPIDFDVSRNWASVDAGGGASLKDPRAEINEAIRAYKQIKGKEPDNLRKQYRIITEGAQQGPQKDYFKEGKVNGRLIARLDGKEGEPIPKMMAEINRSHGSVMEIVDDVLIGSKGFYQRRGYMNVEDADGNDYFVEVRKSEYKGRENVNVSYKRRGKVRDMVDKGIVNGEGLTESELDARVDVSYILFYKDSQDGLVDPLFRVEYQMPLDVHEVFSRDHEQVITEASKNDYLTSANERRFSYGGLMLHSGFPSPEDIERVHELSQNLRIEAVKRKAECQAKSEELKYTGEIEPLTDRVLFQIWLDRFSERYPIDIPQQDRFNMVSIDLPRVLRHLADKMPDFDQDDKTVRGVFDSYEIPNVARYLKARIDQQPELKGSENIKNFVSKLRKSRYSRSREFEELSEIFQS